MKGKRRAPGRRLTRSVRPNPFGKYRILERLGHGGMGTVYRAVDETLGREVAIKVLHSKRADPRAIKRFCAEATALAKVNHPDIATIYDLFRSETALLLVMELVRGETLESICSRVQTLPPPGAASIVDKILSALDHAHRAGIVHCDIKPANVMVTDGGRIKIMDFGTARVRGPRAGTKDRFTIGTPAYMSPEQVLGREVDGRADLYAVGVVLYRLLTANFPFTGDTALAVARQHVAHEPTPLRDHRPDLPAWCETILRRALAKSPDDRFQSAEEFREALRDATGMTAAELNEAFTISIELPEVPSQAHPVARTRVFRTRRAAKSTVALDDADRTLSLFRGVVKRRRRDVVPKSRRAFLGGALAATVAAGIAVMAIAGRHGATAAASAGPSTAGPIVFNAKSCAPRTNRPGDATCRIVLSDDRISVKANATNKQLHDVSYDEVRSVSYSHGFDRASDTPRVSLRTSSAKSELIVLRFDSDAPARQAVGEIEKRTDKHAIPSRETPESNR